MQEISHIGVENCAYQAACEPALEQWGLGWRQYLDDNLYTTHQAMLF